MLLWRCFWLVCHVELRSPYLMSAGTLASILFSGSQIIIALRPRNPQVSRASQAPFQGGFNETGTCIDIGHEWEFGGAGTWSG